MKKTILMISLFGTVMCLNAQSTIDLNAEKAAVNAMLDKWQAATQTDTLASLLTDDAFILGTAPEELWTKNEIVEIWRQYYSGIVPEHSYTSERILKMAADGNSATEIEEYIMPSMSPILTARNTLHLVKTKDKWMVDFISIAFIPKNEDIPKIEKIISE